MGEGMTLLTEENANSLNGIFLVGEMSKFFCCWVEFSSIPRVSQKSSGEWSDSLHLLGGNKDGDIFGKKEDTMGIILEIILMDTVLY